MYSRVCGIHVSVHVNVFDLHYNSRQSQFFDGWRCDVKLRYYMFAYFNVIGVYPGSPYFLEQLELLKRLVLIFPWDPHVGTSRSSVGSLSDTPNGQAPPPSCNSPPNFFGSPKIAGVRQPTITLKAKLPKHFAFRKPIAYYQACTNCAQFERNR
jgi:hypothetical protein